jgi:hypothetical protein
VDEIYSIELKVIRLSLRIFACRYRGKCTLLYKRLTFSRILQPDGVVEFLEIDPTPRLEVAGSSRKHFKDDHKTRAMTDWTDNIADRFKDPLDNQLATDVPGWVERVKERQKAKLRPSHGFAAPNLESWLEGAG